MTAPTDRAEAARDARPLPNLSRLIHPVDVTTFRRDYWERQPLIVHRGDRTYFSDLMTLDDMDRILSVSSLLESLRVVEKGKEIPITELASAAGRNGKVNLLEELYARYRSGHTVVLSTLESRWEPLQKITSALGAEISANVQTNIYLTPAGSQGFAPHYDTHDVFVAQVHGTKHWRLAMDPYRLPLRSRNYDKSQPEPVPEQEFDLASGDVMYLPRGTVHWATSNETASLHITIGIHPILYSDAFVDAILKLFSADVRFRRALPMGFATDEDDQRRAAANFGNLVNVLRDWLSRSDMAGDSVNRATSMNLPTLRHHLTDLEELGNVWTDTPVRRRAGQQWHLSVTGDVVNLEFHNKRVQLPVHVAEEVRYVATSNGEDFTAADIPGDLDEASRLLLVQTLVREGFLTRG